MSITTSSSEAVQARTILQGLVATGTQLRLGDAGLAVRALQSALSDAGFPPGLIDGEFGAGTEAAVMAFQASAALLPDGVAGPRTLTALAAGADGLPLEKAVSAIPAGDATGAMTVQVACRMLPGAPVGNVRQHLPNVLDALRNLALSDRRMVLMAVATIAAETAGFEPIDEFRSRFNTSPGGAPYDLYDFRADLGNGARGDGALYKGRGFVQLTGKSNYARIGAELGVDLVTNPDRANEPVLAARILAEFLKLNEMRIKRALLADDLAGARRAVNGGSHGLPEFTRAYRTGEALIPA